MARTGASILVLCCGVLASLPAAVEGVLEAGISRGRVADGPALDAWTAQPSLLWYPAGFCVPCAGVCLGPVAFVDRDTQDRALAVEGRLVAGLAIGGTGDIRGEVRGAWGWGWWDGRGLGPDPDGWHSWGRTWGADAALTWRVVERVRVGPQAGWTRRHPADGLMIDEWRVGVMLSYDFGG